MVEVKGFQAAVVLADVALTTQELDSPPSKFPPTFGCLAAMHQVKPNL